eukprot:PhM_4_TR6089/c0_g1_i1/m.103610/K08869/ADCK, ABC1; aarF domain-containing kinase
MYMPVFFLYLLMKDFHYTYKLWLRILLYTVQRSGPAIIKFGQWACTRHDMFTKEFRETFSVLYSHVFMHDVRISHQVIADELKPVDELFVDFSATPVGSGSIGQVHIATMRDSGEKVAVKVMHPNVVHDISRDIFLINMGARIIDKLVPAVAYLCLPSTALAWTNHLAAQIDFRIEAENLQYFNDHFQSTEYAQFPRPIAWSQQVLIESFAPGQIATDEFVTAQTEEVKNKLAYIGLNSLCQMLLRDNFIHCDMHPGNIIIDTTTDPRNPKVTLIDVGLVQRLDEQQSLRTNALMTGFVKWDPKKAADGLLGMSEEQGFCDKGKFREDMDKLFEYFRPGGIGAEYAVVGNVLSGCFDLVRENRVHLDPDYVNVMFAILVLESFIMNLNPMFNIAQQAAPWLVSEGHVSRSVYKNLFKTAVVRSTEYVRNFLGYYTPKASTTAVVDIPK